MTEDRVWDAIRTNGLCLLVLRTMLGVTPPEWAELARQEGHEDVDTGFARTVDRNVRTKPNYVRALRRDDTVRRMRGLVSVACVHINEGTKHAGVDTVHRLNRFDTAEGSTSLKNAADLGVPYAVLLYERYLGRPFASHRDSVSELVGDVMESASESRLSAAHVTFRKTKRAERIPGFEQAPDFIVPDEIAPQVVIEAKMTKQPSTTSVRNPAVARAC